MIQKGHFIMGKHINHAYTCFLPTEKILVYLMWNESVEEKDKQEKVK